MKKLGFTLAEVLITLSIIGIVAAMTIPTLVNKMNMKQYITWLKVDYSALSQAFSMIVAAEGSFESATSGCVNTSNKHACFRDIFAEKMKTIGNCDEQYQVGGKNTCFPSSSDIKLLNGKTASGSYLNNDAGTMMLANGSTLIFYLDSPTCEYNFDGVFNYNRCGWITIDVNGYKKPNTFGKDIYVLYVFHDGIKPLAYDFMAPINQDGDCTPESSGYSCSHTYLIN